MDFTQNKYLAPRTVEKMKILAAHLDLPAIGQLISKAIYGVLDSPKKRTKKI
jgi:hypothetical protein